MIDDTELKDELYWEARLELAKNQAALDRAASPYGTSFAMPELYSEYVLWSLKNPKEEENEAI